MDRQELYRVAITAEVRSQKVYQALAKGFSKAETSSLFKQLVQLETIHEAKLREAMDKEFPGLIFILETGPDPELTGLDLSDPKALLDFAMSREDSAREHYLAFAADTHDPELKEMLLRLASEEEGHKTLLLTEMQRIQGALSWYDPSELNGFMDD